jgi:chemotaxis signal transduction protein
MILRSAHGGVMFRVEEELFFLPASVALKLLSMPQVAVVPGAPPELRGIALVDGAMIPVVDVSSRPRPWSSLSRDGKRGGSTQAAEEAMLVCALMGESLGLVGLSVVGTGFFDVNEAGETIFGDRPARTFDVARVIARVRQGRWAV